MNSLDTDKLINDKLGLNEWLYKLFEKLKVQEKRKYFVVCLAIFYQIPFFIIACIISIIYEKKGANFLPIYDQRQLIPLLVCIFIGAPAIWYFYIFQPKWINKIFKSFSNIIDSNENYNESNILKNIISLQKPVYKILIVIISFLFSLTWAISSFQLNDPFLYGQSTNWSHINLYFFWILFVPFQIFIHSYMVFWLLSRQLLTTYLIVQIYKYYKIKLILFHTDHCNGFGEIGKFYASTAITSFLYGLWLLCMIFQPAVSYGQKVNLKIDTIVMILLYLLLIYAFFYPVFFTHKVMKEFKNKALNEASSELKELFPKENQVKFNNMMIKYRVLNKEYRTWPFIPFYGKSLSFLSLFPIIYTFFLNLFSNYISSLILKH